MQLGWYTVTAPISGRVGVVNIKAGNVAKAGDNSASGIFATINQISPIYVAFSVTQTLLPALREAMANGAEVIATPQGSKVGSKGKLAILDNAVDPTTGTIVVRATFDNADERLWPGQLCDLDAHASASNPTRSSCRARRSRSARTAITSSRSPTASRMCGPSRPAEPQDDETVITKGLDGGENVVVDGALLLIEGSKVEVRNAPKGAS